MGRLIDADKLWKATTTSIDYCGEFLEIIEKQETVDVIPVEWIKAQIPDSKEFYAVVTSIILYQLIDKYQREKNGF